MKAAAEDPANGSGCLVGLFSHIRHGFPKVSLLLNIAIGRTIEDRTRCRARQKPDLQDRVRGVLGWMGRRPLIVVVELRASRLPL